MTVVNKLSLTIKKGEIFGFLGPNGAGKSTSINIMIGLLKASKGNILIKGEKIEKINKNILGICPQDIVLWDDLTCFENLMIMGKMYEVPNKKLQKSIPTILEKLYLTDKTNEKVCNLSGGMKRRMNIAMATIHEPEILILDEPSEGLDPQSRRVLWDYIIYQKEKGNTIILTTHLMDEAEKLSDRVAIIDHGKLLQLDTPENLKKSIGEGDMVEIITSTKCECLKEDLEKIDEINKININENRINIHILNAVNKLPEIIHLIEEKKIEIKDISIRQNTLEDVFIKLTGRALRE